MKKNNKLVSILLASSLLLPGIAPLATGVTSVSAATETVATAKQVDAQYVTVVDQVLRNVRSDRAVSNGFVPAGKTVTNVRDAGKGWFQVDYDGNTGYIQRSEVTSVENYEDMGTGDIHNVDTTVDSTRDSKYIVAVTTGLRTKDVDIYRPLRMLDEGEEVEYLGTTDNGWFFVKDENNVEGYVYAGDVTSVENYNDDSTPELHEVDTTNESSREGKHELLLTSSIRTKDNDAYRVISELQRGDVVTYLGTTANNWFKVQTEDKKIGFIYRGDVTAVEEEPEEPAEDLAVESVSAITEINVDVTIAELEADMEDVTVEVKDSKGNTVEVKPANLKKGAKIASFDFVTAVSASDLTGVWTVDGVAFDFKDAKLVEDILEKASGSSDVLALEALNNAGIKNINDDLIGGYKNAINEALPEPATVAEIQKIVNDENAKYDNVKAVIDGAIAFMGEEVKVYKALEDGFDHVESDWSEDYMKAVVELEDGSTVAIENLGRNNYTGVRAVTYEAIQDAVDRVAVDETRKLVNKLYTEEPKAKDLSTARAMVDKYADLAYQVEDEITLGDYLDDKVTQLELLVNVDKASTKASMKSALTRLGDFDKALVKKYEGVDTVTYIPSNSALLSRTSATIDADFKEAEYTKKDNVDNGFAIVDSNLDEYVKEFDNSGWDDKNTVQGVVARVIKVNNEQKSTLIANLKKEAGNYVGDAEKRPAFLKALRDVGAKRVVSDNYATYANKSNGIVAAFAGLSDSAEMKDVQAIVDGANIYEVSKLATEGKKTELVRALRALEIKDLTVDSANKDEYEAAINNLNLGNFDSTSVKADLSAIETAVKNTNKAADIAAGLKAFNDAETKAEAKTALDNLSELTDLADYASVPAGDKEYVANVLLEARNKLTAERTVLGGGASDKLKAKAFRSIEELEHYLTHDVTEVDAKIDFNGDNSRTNGTENGDTLENPLTQRANLIAGVNAVKSNKPATATTETVLELSVNTAAKAVTYKSEDADIVVVDENTGELSLGAAPAAGDVVITPVLGGNDVDAEATTVTVSVDGEGHSLSVDTAAKAVTYASENAEKVAVDSETGALSLGANAAKNDSIDITPTLGSTELTAEKVTVTVLENTVNVPAQSYEAFLNETAQTFKTLGVPGFSKASDPVSSADVALVEKYFNSEAFYSLAEANASDNVTHGDLKQDFRTVSQILEYLK